MDADELEDLKNRIKQKISEKLEDENITNDAENGQIDIETEFKGKVNGSSEIYNSMI